MKPTPPRALPDLGVICDFSVSPPYTFTPDPALEARLQQLHARFPRFGCPDFAAFGGLLERLNNPHLALPPVFHVAGPFSRIDLGISARLAGSGGKRVHVYTSPHLVRFEERYVLAGAHVDPARLDAAFAKVAALVDGEINFSFLMTAVA